MTIIQVAVVQVKVLGVIWSLVKKTDTIQWNREKQQ